MKNNIQIPKKLILSTLDELEGKASFHKILAQTRTSDEHRPPSQWWDLADYQKALKQFFLTEKLFQTGKEDACGDFAISLQPTQRKG